MEYVGPVLGFAAGRHPRVHGARADRGQGCHGGIRSVVARGHALHRRRMHRAIPLERVLRDFVWPCSPSPCPRRATPARSPRSWKRCWPRTPPTAQPPKRPCGTRERSTTAPPRRRGRTRCPKRRSPSARKPRRHRPRRPAARRRSRSTSNLAPPLVARRREHRKIPSPDNPEPGKSRARPQGQATVRLHYPPWGVGRATDGAPS
jgi:hypothetical protein